MLCDRRVKYSKFHNADRQTSRATGQLVVWAAWRPAFAHPRLVIFQVAVTALGHSEVSAQCVTGALPPSKAAVGFS